MVEMPDREYRTRWLWAAVIAADVVLVGAFSLLIGAI